MQMKAPPKKAVRLNAGKMMNLLVKENEFITNLLAIYDVPDSVHDDKQDDLYLINAKQKQNPRPLPAGAPARAKSADALQERLESMKNKMGSKKSKPSEKTVKKRQLKKLKKDGELKKRIVTVAKSIKNERSKEGKLVTQVKEEEGGEDSKADVKPAIFNEDGKMVFSRFEFASRASQAKKSKKDKSVKNPKVILRAINKQKKHINELLEQGDTAKVEKIKEDEAWKKAFDKTAGKTVKDNTTLLHKAIHKKVVRKKKSKLEWKERTDGVEKDMAKRQKTRTENIKKKQSEKKKNKLKKMSKMGRVIPGY